MHAAAAEAGATSAIQPGGSVRDDEVIAAADEADRVLQGHLAHGVGHDAGGGGHGFFGGAVHRHNKFINLCTLSRHAQAFFHRLQRFRDGNFHTHVFQKTIFQIH